MAMNAKTNHLEVFGDLKLIINQVLLHYDVKKLELIPYYKYSKRLLGWFDHISITHIPRNENKQADALAKLATALALPHPKIKIPICQTWVIPPNFDEDEIEEEVNAISIFEIEREDWQQPIIDYIEHVKFPNDPRHRTEIW